MASLLQNVPITIANGATESSVCKLVPRSPVGIVVPATGFTGTTLKFTVSFDGVTFYPLVDSTGTDVAVTVKPGSFHYIDPNVFFGALFITVVAGSAQAADVTLTLTTKVIFS